MLTRNNGVVSGSGGKISRGRVRPGMMPPTVTPPASGTVTQAMIDFRAASLALPESQHNMASDDAMRREMVLATHYLAPRAGATHVAVQNGNWTNPETWLNASNTFQVPGAGAKILIPRGITVTYDSNASTAYDWLRHDGKLQFVTDTDTRLVIDTIVSDHHSEWVQGTEADPITATSIVEFPDNGDINTAVDTLLLGRGWVSMGKVSIYGTAKRNHATCHQTRAIGDTTITLNETPTGWQVGDEISVGGTRLRGWIGDWNGQTARSFIPYDIAHVTITNISGNTITFTPALAHARDLTAVRADPKYADAVYYVGNFTRNVKFCSPPGTAIHRRGHIMFMDQGVQAHNASWDLLGRTRKDIESIDATNDARMDTVYGTGTRPATANVRGRYNFHLHKHGVGAAEKFSEVSGCAASDAPGWLYAHHSAYANFTECVGRRFLGVGLMAEVGNEIGRWERCLMMDGASPRGAGSGGSDKNQANLLLGDFGLFGNAYWGRSRVVELIDCLASDCDSFAGWMSRGGFGGPLSPPFDDVPFPRQMIGTENTGSANNPVLVVKGCRATACRAGMFVVKSGPNQDHSHRSNIYDFMVVNGQVFIFLEYTGKYTFQKVRFWQNAGTPTARPCVDLGQGTVDMIFNDLVIRGRDREGVRVGSGGNETSGLNWDNTFIDYDFGTGPAPDFLLLTGGHDKKLGTTGVKDWTVEEVEAKCIRLTSSAIQVRALEWAPSSEPVLVNSFSGTTTTLNGTITDSIRIKNRNAYVQQSGWGGGGVTPRVHGQAAQRQLIRSGYWTHSGNSYVLMPDMLTDSLMDSSGNYQVRYLTLVVRLNSYATWLTQNNIVNRGALPQRYVDAINASTWRVYEEEPE
jgi:hypothetical protein